jgi:hypothetical protein
MGKSMNFICKWGPNGIHISYIKTHIYIYCQPASWHQAQENMNERCNLSKLNALFAEGKTHIPWAPNWATNSEAGLLILVLWSHFFVFFHELMGSEGIRLAKMPKTEPGGLAER